MTQAETVMRDTRSYRQGLVLGLTMAEVFLLLVFTLLIALAALWNSEKQKRKTLEQRNGQQLSRARRTAICWKMSRLRWRPHPLTA